MAANLPRTTADDVRDALASLDAAEREIANLRAHLTAGPQHIHQARRVSGIVEAEVGRAAWHVHSASLHPPTLAVVA